MLYTLTNKGEIMGLDQYLNKVVVTKQVQEIKRWRKNNQLQGWFEENFNQQNCVPTTLNKHNIEMLDQLLAELKEASLPITGGFFYGSEKMDKEEYEDLIKIFTAVHTDIIENSAEYEYDCWY
jgi:uncharacterized protein YfkK (UPF0435 family)